MSNHDNKDVANRLRDEVFLPALQEAARSAQKLDTDPGNLLNGVVGAFSSMLVTLVGSAGAVHLLRGLADHIDESNKSPV